MAPFPAMRLGPDTQLSVDGVVIPWRYNHYGGYNWVDDQLVAVSLTHLQGAGMDDLGNVGFTLVRAWDASSVVNASQTMPYRSSFSHGNESASPGYYSVRLLDADATVEATVNATHAGMLRFTCEPSAANLSAPCIAVVDVCHTTHTNPCPFSNVSIAAGMQAGAVAVSGCTLDAGDFAQLSPIGGVWVCFHAEFTAHAGSEGGPVVAPLTAQVWSNNALHPASVSFGNSTTGNVGAAITFPAPPSPASPLVITSRIGLSFRSAAMATANLLTQQAGGGGGGNVTWPSFDAVRASADAQWGALLGRLNVTMPTPAAAQPDVEGREDAASRDRSTRRPWTRQRLPVCDLALDAATLQQRECFVLSSRVPHSAPSCTPTHCVYCDRASMDT
jgi:putative alpha-1,2-mannosidase